MPWVIKIQGIRVGSSVFKDFHYSCLECIVCILWFYALEHNTLDCSVDCALNS